MDLHSEHSFSHARQQREATTTRDAELRRQWVERNGDLPRPRVVIWATSTWSVIAHRTTRAPRRSTFVPRSFGVRLRHL